MVVCAEKKRGEEILNLLKKGYSSTKISLILDITETEIKTEIREMMKKYRARNRIELILAVM